MVCGSLELISRCTKLWTCSILRKAIGANTLVAAQTDNMFTANWSGAEIRVRSAFWVTRSYSGLPTMMKRGLVIRLQRTVCDMKRWLATGQPAWISISISISIRHLVGGPRVLFCPLFVVPDVPPLDLQRIRSRAQTPERTGHLHVLPAVRRHVMRDLCEESWREKEADKKALKGHYCPLMAF